MSAVTLIKPGIFPTIPSSGPNRVISIFNRPFGNFPAWASWRFLGLPPPGARTGAKPSGCSCLGPDSWPPSASFQSFPPEKFTSCKTIPSLPSSSFPSRRGRLPFSSGPSPPPASQDFPNRAPCRRSLHPGPRGLSGCLQGGQEFYTYSYDYSVNAWRSVPVWGAFLLQGRRPGFPRMVFPNAGGKKTRYPGFGGRKPADGLVPNRLGPGPSRFEDSLSGTTPKGRNIFRAT